MSQRAPNVVCDHFGLRLTPSTVLQYGLVSALDGTLVVASACRADNPVGYTTPYDLPVDRAGNADSV